MFAGRSYLTYSRQQRHSMTSVRWFGWTRLSSGASRDKQASEVLMPNCRHGRQRLTVHQPLNVGHQGPHWQPGNFVTRATIEVLAADDYRGRRFSAAWLLASVTGPRLLLTDDESNAPLTVAREHDHLSLSVPRDRCQGVACQGGLSRGSVKVWVYVTASHHHQPTACHWSRLAVAPCLLAKG